MPEILTKHPKIVKKILNNTKVVKCGKPKPKKRILTQCPDDSFCSLPTGELCIYDYKNVNKMTQINTPNLIKISNKLQKHCSLCGANTHIKSNRNYHP